MKFAGFELRRLELPLVSPFRTSFGTELHRDVLLVRAVGADGAEGYGECVAGITPGYSAEYVDGAHEVVRRFLIPALAELEHIDATRAEQVFAAVKGHPMAKAAVQTAILDAQLRVAGMSFASFFGAVRPTVAAGVSVGIMDSIPELLDAVDGYLNAGYVRIKLKIEPGWDVEPVRAVRERWGDILLQVDANTAYTLADARQLARLDPFDLLLMEQPLPEDDVRGHAALAKLVRTPICLDESITSARAAADAIALGAAAIVNIKPGRVGGYLEARRIHDVCVAAGVPVWAGGMLETGIGRAANVALAALPGFTLPGDTSASDRYFARDITPAFVLENGALRVPVGPGIGIDPEPVALREATTNVEYISL